MMNKLSMHYEYEWHFDFICEIKEICHVHIHKLARALGLP